jgi:peptidyl-prolyl cis-trans isomerase SurA
VVDIRANRGEMSAAHIMITKATDPSKETETKTKIDDIYKKIQQGESFESLATQFSDDKSSSDKGGVLNRFGSGQLNSEEFESVAFGLSKINPMSKPFQSAYGWHIVKFIEKFPVRTAKEMQQELNTKISKDERSRKIAASINNSLRKEYKLTVDAAVYTDILETVTADYTAGTWKLPENIIILEKSIVTIGAKKISTKQFLTYLNEQQRSYKDSKLSLKTIVDKNLEKFSDEQLNLFADENLENKFPEFANVVEEYRDGLLLFDLMEKEIWEKAKNDSTGLKTFFNKNKENYKWKKRLDVSIASSLKKEVTEQALAMLKAGRSAAEIKKAINTEQSVNVIFSEGVFEEGNSVLQKNVTFKTGVSDIIQNKEYYYITKVNKLLPDNLKTFDESKGKVINDYQQYLEKNWVTELKREFVVKVNQDIFEKIRAQIQK